MQATLVSCRITQLMITVMPHNNPSYCYETDDKVCLQGLLTSCMQHTDFKSMPSQVICLAGSIQFTQQAEQAIETGKLIRLQVRWTLLNCLTQDTRA